MGFCTWCRFFHSIISAKLNPVDDIESRALFNSIIGWISSLYIYSQHDKNFTKVRGTSTRNECAFWRLLHQGSVLRRKVGLESMSDYVIWPIDVVQDLKGITSDLGKMVTMEQSKTFWWGWMYEVKMLFGPFLLRVGDPIIWQPS